MTKLPGIFLALFSAIAFGVYPPAVKLAYADGANATFVLILTTFCRATFLSCYCLFKGQALLPESGKWRVVILGGLYQAISTFGIIASLAYLPAPITIIVMFTHSIMLLFYLAYLKEIRLTRLAVVSTLSALTGLSFVLDIWSQDFDLSTTGLLFAVMAAIATTNRLYIFGKQTLILPPAVVGAQTFLGSFIFILCWALYQKPIAPSSVVGLDWVLLCCLSTVIGSFGMFFGIASMGSFRWSLLLKFEPIFTAIFSVILLGEILRTPQYFGMLLVLGSLVVYQLFEKRTDTVPAVAISIEPD